ncbi:hypothetical protein JAAARDRAFT_197269 [Jaapia argillacea MUCL 33604]|uniref:Uncharacterized protein n=1 Tax=Jaapia argillacea MUCL 33604 TaxID=933084 RepID=A0A067PFC4_9AGAM|nr:hypothetical protein JAAARDRAFT_197269 [Jaapia argillacea MUCL 33604]
MPHHSVPLPDSRIEPSVIGTNAGTTIHDPFTQRCIESTAVKDSDLKSFQVSKVFPDMGVHTSPHTHPRAATSTVNMKPGISAAHPSSRCQRGIQFDLDLMGVEDGGPTSADGGTATDPHARSHPYRHSLHSMDDTQQCRTQAWVAAGVSNGFTDALVDITFPGKNVVPVDLGARVTKCAPHPPRIQVTGTTNKNKEVLSCTRSVQKLPPSEPLSSLRPLDASGSFISSLSTPEVPRSSRCNVFPVATAMTVDYNPAYFGRSLAVESNRSQSQSVVSVLRNILPLSFVSNSRVPNSGAPDSISGQMKLGYQAVSRSQPSTPIAAHSAAKHSSGLISVKGGSIPLRSVLALRRKDESLHHISQMVFNYVGKNSLGHIV